MRMPPHPSTRFRALISVVGLTATLLVGAVAASVPASAVEATAHDPIGAVTSYRAGANGGVRMIGWAADPDALHSNTELVSIVDGRTAAWTSTTSVASPSIAAAHHTGPTPAFDVTIPVSSGAHYVCLDARNVSYGIDTLLKCVESPVYTYISIARRHTRDPIGAIQHSWANSASIHLQGWATDPDYVSGRMRVVLYVDGSVSATSTTVYYPGTRPTGSGYRSAFDILVPTPVGAHLGCIWAVNVGIGYNKFLGCRSMDNRGPAGTGTVTTPALNTRALTEAKRHLGQSYVWGATGPTTFDCSGLVIYSYRIAGMTLSTRTAAQQFAAARLIPSSRVVPGDLVFTHDSSGDVYHVGIYVSPGRAFAAIDTYYGVNYQNIWDPTNTTYGSFTHT